MNSDLPKVMHPAFGKPLVEWVVDAVVDAGARRVILVVGHQQEVVRKHFAARLIDRMARAHCCRAWIAPHRCLCCAEMGRC